MEKVNPNRRVYDTKGEGERKRFVRIRRRTPRTSGDDRMRTL